MSTTLITIGEILELAPGDRNAPTWVNGEFEALVSDCKPARGKGPATAFLTDPDNESIAILANFFGSDPARFEGKLVHVSGKGISRTEYKGTQQITIGDKATVQVIGAGPGAAAAQAAPASRPSAGAGPSSAPSVIFGATVGMALNQAMTVIRENHAASFTPEQRVKYFDSPDFSRDLWTVASDIVRIARVMEAGKLAANPKHRADPEAEERETAANAAKAKEAAERERAAHEAEKAAKAARKAKDAAPPPDDPDDVPF